MTYSCKKAREELVRLALTPEDGAPSASLRLHLEECDACQAVQTQESIAALRSASPPVLEPTRRDALFARAIARASEEQSTRTQPRFYRFAIAGTVIAVIVALVIGMVAFSMVRSGPRIQFGEVAEERGDLLPVGHAVPLDVELVARKDAEVELRDHSSIKVARGTRFSMRRGEGDAFVLESGALSLRVQPRAPRKPLTVTTHEAVVRVVGTRFAVTRDELGSSTTVTVDEGRVEVSSLGDGGRRTLGPGETLTVGERHDFVTQPELAPTPAVSTNGAHADADGPRVEAIRSSIRAGRIKEARISISRARESARSNRFRLAELSIVEAEADLAEGRTAVALERYLAVTKNFRGTPQAEDAFFAAAQLAVDTWPDEDRGRKLLSSYLATYPHGHFRNEAQRMLQALKQQK